MSSSRVVPLFALLAVMGIAIGPAKAQPAKRHGLDKETLDGIMKVVTDAAKTRNYRHDQRHGDGKTPFEDTPSKPGLLIGLDIWPGVRDKTTQFVRGVRPLFLNNKGEKSQGRIHGWVGSGSVRVQAKPGYAVGGLKIHTDFGEIAGVSLVFYKITAAGLDKDDSYESTYYGHKDPNTARLVGGTGEPILGIYGLVADSPKSHNFGLGLIIVGDDKKKKKRK